MDELSTSVEALGKFAGSNLGVTLSDIESRLVEGDINACTDLNGALGIGETILSAAAQVKRAAAQIDVVIHALGILHLLPSILGPDEQIQYLSLGAGNTGKKYDMETDRQIAEFTFIAWRGGSEAIRQSKLFVDFMHLAEAHTTKAKKLFVLGLQHPLKFLNSGRTIRSVLSRRPDEMRFLNELYGEALVYVNQYYGHHSDSVSIVDVSPLLPSALLAPTPSVGELEDV